MIKSSEKEVNLENNSRSAGALTVLTGEAAVTASQLFDRKGTGRFAIVAIIALSLAIVLAILWASVMPIAEISVSSGEIVPSGSVQHIQHLEGGILAHLLVAEGETVKKGQQLIKLAPDIAEPELAQLRTRRKGISLRIGLLSSALNGVTPKIDKFEPRYRDIALAESQALAAKRDSIASQSTVLQQQVSERKAELATLLAREKTIDEQIVLTKERIDGRRALVKKGYFSRMQLIEDERDFSNLVGERVAVDKEAIRIHERIREAASRMTELVSKFKSEIATEISTLTKEAAELQLTIDRARDRVARLTITAPAAGRVQGLQTRTIGGVITPGATLMDIIPDDVRPHVEARVSTRDIGHVHPGQEATIKVLTYDYSRYGIIKGVVEQVSPSTFMDEDGRPYYKAQISLMSRFVGDDETMPVSSGMTVLADIITGERTLLTYLISPIIRSFDTALRER